MISSFLMQLFNARHSRTRQESVIAPEFDRRLGIFLETLTVLNSVGCREREARKANGLGLFRGR
jgi:hypothetical protein